MIEARADTGSSGRPNAFRLEVKVGLKPMPAISGSWSTRQRIRPRVSPRDNEYQGESTVTSGKVKICCSPGKIPELAGQAEGHNSCLEVTGGQEVGSSNLPSPTQKCSSDGMVTSARRSGTTAQFRKSLLIPSNRFAKIGPVDGNVTSLSSSACAARTAVDSLMLSGLILRAYIVASSA
jgi:hypothetical protein